MQIVETVIRVNDSVKQRMVDKIVNLCGGSLQGLTIAVLGVTFKPNTDDMRDAPSLTIIPALLQAGAAVRVTDPQGQHEGAALLGGVSWADDPYQAAEGADLVVLLTEWNEFRGLDLSRLAGGMARARMVDLRNVYDQDELRAAGFTEIAGIGR
jgi:UDPglucose 6-dehydrogenase